MSSNLEALCASLCEITGVPAPELAMDDNGVTAFTVRWDGVELGVVHDRHRPDQVTFAVNLGPVEPSKDARACRVLMEVNFLASSMPLGPCAARNPVSGEFVLSCSRRLADCSGHEVHTILTRLVELANNWRRTMA